MTNIAVVQTPTLPTNPRPIISVGAGGIVHDAHYPAYQKAGFPIVGLFDLDLKRAEFMCTKFGVPNRYRSLSEAVVQAPKNAIFDVAVPASVIPEVLSHLPLGSAVLIQKPMGENLYQARAIRDLCRQKGLQAAINFQLRTAPFILAAQSLIDQGIIGAVHDMEIRITVYTPWQLWTFLEAVPHPEILYHSIHYIDLIRAFLDEPKGIYAKTVQHPDALKMDGTRTSIIFDYGQWLRANIETNHHHKYGLKHQESYVKWEGTEGAIKITMGLLMNYPDGKPDQFEYCILVKNQNPKWVKLDIEGSWFPDAFIGSMASLMRFVDGETNQLPTSVEDAFQTMAVTEAACQASASGSTPIPT